MNRLAKTLSSLGIIALGVLVATAGWAYWTTLGAGTGSASVGTLNPPTGVTVPDSPVAGSVAVSWTPPTVGAAPTAYDVERSADIDDPAEDRTWQPACGGPVSAPATSCNEDVADGTYIYRVTAVFASWTAVSAPSGPVTISTVVTPSKLALTGSGDNLKSGSTRQFIATIQDESGNTVTSGTHTVTFAQSAGTGSVIGLGAAQAANGQASITVTGHLAGPITLHATADFGSGTVTSNSAEFSVVHGDATQITLTGSHTEVPSGTTSVLTATVKDSAGNAVTTGPDASRNVTFTKAGGDGSVIGLPGGTPAVAGIASLTVTGDAAGPITARASTTLTAGAVQSDLPFTVTIGDAYQLAFTQQPSNATVGTLFPTQPKVTVQDYGGNTVSTGIHQVTIAIGTNPAGGTLSGTKTVSTVNGVANFTGLSIDKLGSYTFTATSGSLTTNSAPFGIYGNVAGLIFSNVKVDGTTVSPSCTGTIGSTYACTTSGKNNAVVTADVGFANSSGTATVYGATDQDVSWTSTGKLADSGTVTVQGGQTNSSSSPLRAQKTGSNSARITATFTNWNGQQWVATLTVN